MLAGNVPEMLTINEVRERTGLSYSLLRRLCLENRIVYFKTGTKYLINYDKLIDFLNGESVSDQENVPSESFYPQK